MPANLTPVYREAEQRFRDAETIEEKIETLKQMIAVLPKHKGTDHLFGDLKRRLAKLTMLHEQQGKAGRHGDAFKVERQGAGQVALIGPPNSGKSRIVANLTGAHTEVAPYPFTTQIPIPGMMEYGDTQVQLVDTAPVSEDYFAPWLSGLVRKCDLVLLVLDVGDDAVLEHLEFVTTTFSRMKIELFPGPEESVPMNIAGKRTLVIANKMDTTDADTRLHLLRASLPPGAQCHEVSAEHGEGLEALRGIIYQGLCVIRVHTKVPGQKAELKAPYVLPIGSTVIDLARSVHKDFAEGLRYARIWGSGQFDGQAVAREHVLAEGDVVELHT